VKDIEGIERVLEVLAPRWDKIKQTFDAQTDAILHLPQQTMTLKSLRCESFSL
jgi:hypothetical protein